jgi:hypothetical protein
MTISIIIEWENARLSAAARSVRLLSELRLQAADIGTGPVELLLLFDPAETDAEELGAMLETQLGPPDGVIDWRLVEAAEAGYYRMKDQGARLASGDTLVFLDSDIVPEPGWLKELLSPFDDPGVQAVTGCTYIETPDLVSRVFALTWFFPLRSRPGPVVETRSFFANNLAFRRSLYERYPFPRLRGTSRGACIALAEQFVEEGITVYRNPTARVGHPAPNGLKHFIWRALAQGRDRLSRERMKQSRWGASIFAGAVRWIRHCGGSVMKILTRFYRVQLNPLLIPCAIAIAWAYYSLYWCGELMSHLNVPAIRRVRV